MRLSNVIDNYIIEGGIFTRLSQMYTLPFITSETDTKALDIDFMSLYGNRETSALIDNLLEGGYVLVQNAVGEYVVDRRSRYMTIKRRLSYQEIIDLICVIIYQRFNKQWSKLYNTMLVTYNPIHNYDMTENENENISINNNDTTTSTSNSVNDSATYGFNQTGSTPTPTNKDTNNASQTDTRQNTQNNQDTRNLHRSGNIGVTTSQKMLEEERNVWIYDFFKTIFKQVGDLLTCPIYIL